MGRVRKPQSSDIQRGLICRRDDTRFFRIFSSLAEDEGFCNLTPSAQMLYLRMGLASGGKIEFEFPRSVYVRYMARGTFEAAKKQLIDGGFITEVSFRCSRSQYRFSNDWMNRKKPSIEDGRENGK